MKHSAQAGFVLLMDVMLSMLIMSILVAMAVPNVIQIQRTNEMIAAKARVANLANVQSAISLCNASPGCRPSVALTVQIPPNGSTVRQGAYVYTFTDLGGGLWTYQATAMGGIFSPTGHNFWVGTAGIMYCGDWPDNSNPC
jgi:type II secretory pathway pseudopilin PulG